MTTLSDDLERLAMLKAKIREKQKELDDIEDEYRDLNNKLTAQEQAKRDAEKKFADDAAEAAIPVEALKRLKEVGLRDFWTAPKGKQP